MSEQPENGSSHIPEAATPVVKPNRSISIVWIVPLVAVLIGIGLVYKAFSEKGPTITITFKSAEGLEAGKTRIKYKDVELGKVTAIDLSEDFSRVTVTAEMVREARHYLTDQTRFWVVRARVAAGQITGLGTLFSGVYIGIEPATGGEAARDFEGLEKQPMVTGEIPGRQFILTASRLGSLNPGSPIYFRQIRVGQVVDYQLAPDGQSVDVQVFIEAPYHQYVRRSTRFWVASGLDLNLSADGIRIHSESVVSLLIGGIVFSNFTHEDPGPEADTGMVFKLYDTFEQARDDRYTIKQDYLLAFKDSVRGLSIGAPVEFRGIPVGTVTDFELQADLEQRDFTIPVRIRLEPQRLGVSTGQGEPLDDQLLDLIEQGLRAQLKTANLLTGQLYIGLEFFDEPGPADMRYRDGLPVIPTMPAASRELSQGIARVVKRLDELPLEAMGRDLQHTLAGLDRLVNGPDVGHAVRSLRRLLAELETTTQTLNAETVPKINAVLGEMDTVIKDLNQWASADAPLQDELRGMLRELASAGRAVRHLADMLERHPEALIRGKGSEGR